VLSAADYLQESSDIQLTHTFEKTNMRLFYLFVLTIMLSLGLLGQASPFPQLHNNQTKAIQRRACDWDTQTNEFICDGNLPTLDEIVAKMRDPNNGGKALPDRPSIFYSKLGSITQVSLWIFGWTRTAGMSGKWYWLYGCMTSNPQSCKLESFEAEDASDDGPQGTTRISNGRKTTC
jgi:hypothetical protein